MKDFDMKLQHSLFFAVAFAIAVIIGAANKSTAAEDPDAGLFVNLTTLNSGMAGHAMVFAGKALKRGHPVVVFLNHKAVLLATDGVPHASYQGQDLGMHLGDLISSGATVIVCQMCMKAHGMTEPNLVEGAKIGNPELVQGYLFDPKYKVMSW